MMLSLDPIFTQSVGVAPGTTTMSLGAVAIPTGDNRPAVPFSARLRAFRDNAFYFVALTWPWLLGAAAVAMVGAIAVNEHRRTT